MKRSLSIVLAQSHNDVAVLYDDFVKQLGPVRY